MATSEERQQMTTISGLPPHQHRFKNKPTVIAVPRNNPPHVPSAAYHASASGQNPYQATYVRRATGSTGPAVGNQTARRTLTRGLNLQEDQGPPTKRRKVSGNTSSSGQVKSGLFKPKTSRPQLAPESDYLDDYGDDMPDKPNYVETLSSRRQSSPADPLNIRSRTSSHWRQTLRHDYMQSPAQGSEKNNPIIVPDGKHTDWAKKRPEFNHDELDNPIEIPSDDLRPSSSDTRFVQNKMFSYEESESPRMIDLASRQKKFQGKAKSMKGKNLLHKQKQPAPLNFEPTIGKRESLLKSNRGQKGASFPVKEAYLGRQLYPVHAGQQLEMFWNVDVLRMEADQDEVYTIYLSPEHCKTFNDSFAKDIPPVIQLKSVDDKLATIRLHIDYDANMYQKLRSKMRINTETTTITPTSDRLWEVAIMAAQESSSSNVQRERNQTPELPNSNRDTQLKPSEKRARLDSLRFGRDSASHSDKRNSKPLPPSNPASTGSPNSSSCPVQPIKVLEIDSNPRGDNRQETRTSNLRRSTRNAPSKEHSAVADELILVYPPGPGAVNINKSDLDRLNPGEYLNDTLIEFGLKLWLKGLEEDNPILASQIHIFNSFFYKKLNQGKDVQQTFESIRKWTSKFDIFEKRYIIVPINENLHWYLAIICEPGHILSPNTRNPPPRKQTRSGVQAVAKASSPAVSSNSKDDHVTSSEAEVERNLNNDFQSSCVIEDDDMVDLESHVTLQNIDVDAVSSTAMSYVTQKDEDDQSCSLRSSVSERPDFKPTERSPSASSTGMLVDGIEEIDAAPNRDSISTERFYQARPKSLKGKERAQSVIDVLTLDDSVDDILANNDEAFQQTYIFIMDSLGTRHPQAVNKLSKYLKLEAKDKKGILDVGSAVGKFASVPVQPNFCDCGVYLLHFARTFMSDPMRYSKGILSQSTKSIANKERQQTWNDSEVAQMRQNLTAIIRRLSDDWKTTKINESQDDDDDDSIEIIESNLKKGGSGIKGTSKGTKNSAKTTTTETSLVTSKTPARHLRGG